MSPLVLVLVSFLRSFNTSIQQCLIPIFKVYQIVINGWFFDIDDTERQKKSKEIFITITNWIRSQYISSVSHSVLIL